MKIITIEDIAGAMKTGGRNMSFRVLDTNHTSFTVSDLDRSLASTGDGT